MARWNGVLHEDGGLFSGWAGSVEERDDLLEIVGPPSPEYMTLRLDRMERGRSAVSFIFVDQHRREHIVSCSGMMVLVQQGFAGTMDAGGWISCWWKQVKQGQKYSIEPTQNGRS